MRKRDFAACHVTILSRPSPSVADGLSETSRRIASTIGNGHCGLWAGKAEGVETAWHYGLLRRLGDSQHRRSRSRSTSFYRTGQPAGYSGDPGVGSRTCRLTVRRPVHSKMTSSMRSVSDFQYRRARCNRPHRTFCTFALSSPTQRRWRRWQRQAEACALCKRAGDSSLPQGKSSTRRPSTGPRSSNSAPVIPSSSSRFHQCPIVARASSRHT